MKTKYYINEAKRVVISVLESEWGDIFEGRVTGMAKCDPADEWNEQTGKIIANTRAHVKYHEMVAKGYIEDLITLNKKIKEIRTALDHHYEVIDNLTEKLEKLEADR